MNGFAAKATPFGDLHAIFQRSKISASQPPPTAPEVEGSQKAQTALPNPGSQEEEQGERRRVRFADSEQGKDDSGQGPNGEGQYIVFDTLPYLWVTQSLDVRA